MSGNEFSALFAAIYANAVSLWAGILGLIATGAGLYWQKTPTGKVFFIAGLIAVLLSPALAFRDEYRKRLAADRRLDELTKPDFRLSIESTAIGHTTNRPNDSIVTVWCRITNLGAPSVASDWKLFVIRPRAAEKRFEATHVITSQGPVTFDSVTGESITYSGREELADKTAQEPIPLHGARVGFLVFLVPNIRANDLNIEAPTLIVTTKDVNGREYTAEVRRTPNPRQGLPYIPGLERPPEPKH